MYEWTTTVRLTPTSVWVLVTDPEGHDVLKARLPFGRRHPRALLTLLEGLALWSGRPICAVLAVVGPSARSHATTFFGDGDPWPEDSALVHFDFAAPRPRSRRRLRGLGDFRRLRLIARAGGER